MYIWVDIQQGLEIFFDTHLTLVYFQGVILRSYLLHYKMYSHFVEGIKFKNTKYNKNINFTTCACFHVCHFVSFDSVGRQSSNTFSIIVSFDSVGHQSRNT
jgi:hypothetical protein